MSSLRFHRRLENKHLKQIIDIDREQFEIEPSDAALACVEQKPWIYTVLEKDEEVIGYGQVLPLNRFAFNGLKNGDLGEDELFPKHIMTYQDCYGLYIGSIAVNEKANPIERSRLVGMVMGQILRMPVKTIAVTVSNIGDSIAKEIGMAGSIHTGENFKGIKGYTPMIYSLDPMKYL